MAIKKTLAQAWIARGRPPGISPDEPAIEAYDDGSYGVNGDKYRVQWRWRVGQLAQGGVSSALPAGTNTPQDVIIDFGSQGVLGDSEIAYFFGRETTGNNRFAMRPQLGPPINQYLANVPISSNLILGTAQLPGYLPSSLYAYLNSDLNLHPQSLGGIPETVELGCFCRTWNDDEKQAQARRAAHEGWFLPSWVGPQDKLNPSLTGPEVTIAPGATVKLRFPAPSSHSDFIAGWILDDSTSTTGLEPLLNVMLQEEDTRERLIDLPTGIDWRNFLACPTVTIVGMPNGGVVRAMSLKGPRGGWTHRVPATSSIEALITSADAGTVTFRACLLGWNVGSNAAPGRGLK